MSQENVKSLLDKINLLFNVFMKDGIDNISALEKDLLKEQINNLWTCIDGIKTGDNAPEKEKVAMDSVQLVAETEVLESIIPAHVAKMEFIEEIKEVVEEPQKQDLKVEKLDITKEVTEKREFSTNKPTRSLKQIIDLNKSFVLKAELFNNNAAAYNDFVNQLNLIESDLDSVRFVEKTAEQLNWNIEDKPYELLLRAVEKRFLPLLQQ